MFKAKIKDRTFVVTEKNKDTLIDGIPFSADVLEYEKGKFHIIVNSQSLSAEILSTDTETKTCMIRVRNSVVKVELKDRYDELLHEIGIDDIAGKQVKEIKAPMPGMVLQVMVESGQEIRKGDALVVLEAMKMENILKSPADGIVKKIHVLKGDKVEKNQVMVNLD